MSIIDTIFENKQVADYMEQQLHNNWSDTRFEDYPRLDPKQKGVFGELYVEALMRTLGHDITPPTNPGHDRTIDGIKTEIKFSLAGSNRRKDGKLIDPDSFTFNHQSHKFFFKEGFEIKGFHFVNILDESKFNS